MITQKDIDQAIREEEPRPAPLVEPEPEVKFSTVFDNRSEDPWKIYVGSKVFAEIPPHTKAVADQWMETQYSQWEEVTRTASGKITFKERDGFRADFPPDAFLTRLVNETDKCQVLRIGDSAQELQPGFYKTVAVGFDDPYAGYEVIKWEKRTKQVREGNYLREETGTEMTMIPRGKKEMARLRQAIEDIAVEIARRHAPRLPKTD
jgi:hypothetical protein